MGRAEKRRLYNKNKNEISKAFKISVGIAKTLLEQGFAESEVYDVLRNKYQVPAEIAPDVVVAARESVDMPLDDPELEAFVRQEAVEPRVLKSIAVILAILAFVIIITLMFT